METGNLTTLRPEVNLLRIAVISAALFLGKVAAGTSEAIAARKKRVAEVMALAEMTRQLEARGMNPIERKTFSRLWDEMGESVTETLRGIRFKGFANQRQQAQLAAAIRKARGL